MLTHCKWGDLAGSTEIRQDILRFKALSVTSCWKNSQEHINNILSHTIPYAHLIASYVHVNLQTVQTQLASVTNPICCAAPTKSTGKPEESTAETPRCTKKWASNTTWFSIWFELGFGKLDHWIQRQINHLREWERYFFPDPKRANLMFY